VRSAKVLIFLPLADPPEAETNAVFRAWNPRDRDQESEDGSRRTEDGVVAATGGRGEVEDKRAEDSDFNGLNEGEACLNDLNAVHRAAPAVYSIFTGRKPYLDEYLTEQGKLTFVDTIEKVSQIKIAKRDRPEAFVPETPELIKEVVEQLLELASK